MISRSFTSALFHWMNMHARCICHQEQSRTFAICSLKIQSSADESKMHFIRLLNDQTFEFISTYPLDTFEYGCSILSCSFSDDRNVYYCVGTAYVLPEENEPTKAKVTKIVIIFFVQKYEVKQKELKNWAVGTTYFTFCSFIFIMNIIGSNTGFYSGRWEFEAHC